MPLTDPPNPKIWSTSQISLFTLIYIENIANIGNKPNPISVHFREAQCQTTWVQKKSQFFHDRSRFVIPAKQHTAWRSLVLSKAARDQAHLYLCRTSNERKCDEVPYTLRAPERY